MITYFVVQTFQRGKRGAVVADSPVQATDRDHAIRLAERLARTKAGSVAFQRSGDMATGEYEDAIVLFRAGVVPDLDDGIGEVALAG
jgi:hypothetical protein